MSLQRGSDSRSLERPSPTASPTARPLVAVARRLAVHDWLILGFLGWLWLEAWQGMGPDRPQCLLAMSVLLGAFVVTLALVRGHVVAEGATTYVLYRVMALACVQLTYFVLRKLLPEAQPGSLDDALYRLDLRLFGVEPTLWADRFVTPHLTEWFSFFYFSYFALLIAHVIPILFFERRVRLLSEFGLAMFAVVCLTHVLYFLVPGFGPHRHLAALFHHSLPAGRWHDMVMRAVASGGAQKDIFPSLHTGAPSLMAMFSFRHRAVRPFRYSWPLVAFFSVNIMGATIYLRWHYLVDVIAGLALAWAATAIAPRVIRWEERRRERLGLEPTWPRWRGDAASEC